MDMNIAFNTALPHHVYHLRPIWRVFYAGIYPLINLIAGLLFVVNVLSTDGTSAFGLFLVLWVVIAVCYNIYYGIRMSMARLVTSQAGVVYYGVGFHVFAPWNAITGIGRMQRRLINLKGFMLQQPVTLSRSVNDAVQSQGPVIEISFWRRPFYKYYTRMIPLTWFARDISRSPLAHDIQWSAPHLLSSGIAR